MEYLGQVDRVMESLKEEVVVMLEPSVSTVFLAKMELLLTLMVVIFSMLCLLLAILLLM